MTKNQQPPDATPQELTSDVRDVSVTERGAFRTCRRRWYLGTVLNLQPKGPSDLALEFGSAMHSALEAYYLEPSRAVGIELAYMELDKWEQGTEAVDQAQHELLLEHYELGLTMLEGYFAYDQVAPVQLGKVLAVEGNLIIPDFAPSPPDGYGPECAVIRHPSGRLMVPIVDEDRQPLHIDHPDFSGTPYLTARIDLLTERNTPKTGVWITDHKHLGKAPSDKGLDFDDQVTGYCYVVWRWTGLIPRGAIYNALLKNKPKEPRLVQSKRKSEGLVLSTAKDQQCTPDAYREALKEHGLMIGNRITSPTHAECLAALLARGWDPFFRRYEITRNLEQMLSFERRLKAEYIDMFETRFGISDHVYPNPHPLLCPRCDVRNICLAFEDGSDVEDVIESQYVEGPDRKAMKL